MLWLGPRLCPLAAEPQAGSSPVAEDISWHHPPAPSPPPPTNHSAGIAAPDFFFFLSFCWLYKSSSSALLSRGPLAEKPKQGAENKQTGWCRPHTARPLGWLPGRGAGQAPQDACENCSQPRGLKHPHFLLLRAGVHGARLTHQRRLSSVSVAGGVVRSSPCFRCCFCLRSAVQRRERTMLQTRVCFECGK